MRRRSSDVDHEALHVDESVNGRGPQLDRADVGDDSLELVEEPTERVLDEWAFADGERVAHHRVGPEHTPTLAHGVGDARHDGPVAGGPSGIGVGRSHERLDDGVAAELGRTHLDGRVPGQDVEDDTGLLLARSSTLGAESVRRLGEAVDGGLEITTPEFDPTE